MTAREIVRQYLREHGFDGLCYEYTANIGGAEKKRICGCGGKTLFMCVRQGDPCHLRCNPAYRHRLKECEAEACPMHESCAYIADGEPVWHCPKKKEAGVA